MNTQLIAQGFRLREYLPSDIPAFVAILNRTFPDNPRDVEKEKYMESIYPPDNPRLRYAVENSAGRVIGVGTCLRPFWMNMTDTYSMWITIDPAWRRRGIGRSMLGKLEVYAQQQGAVKLRTDCREDSADSIEFLKTCGFNNYGLRFESQIDLTQIAESKFGAVIDRATADGYEFTTLAAERTINPEADRCLYELDELTSEDVPLPGGARWESSFENFKHMNLEGPESDVNAIGIAKYRGQFVGLTIVWFGKDKPAYTAMTGVRREHRGHGLALALKLLSFRAIKARGYTAVRTTNDTANPAILRLNEKLGYQKLPGNMLWEKVISHE